MEEIINKILKLEDRAQQIIADAEDDKEKLENEFDAKVNQLKADIENKEKRELSQKQNEERLKNEKRIGEINQKLQQQKQMLYKRSENEKGKWVSSIFEEIFQ